MGIRRFGNPDGRWFEPRLPHPSRHLDVLTRNPLGGGGWRRSADSGHPAAGRSPRYLGLEQPCFGTAVSLRAAARSRRGEYVPHPTDDSRQRSPSVTTCSSRWRARRVSPTSWVSGQVWGGQCLVAPTDEQAIELVEEGDEAFGEVPPLQGKCPPVVSSCATSGSCAARV